MHLYAFCIVYDAGLSSLEFQNGDVENQRHEGKDNA